jgi:hypothetical protein
MLRVYQFKAALLARCAVIGIDAGIAEVGDKWLEFEEQFEAYRRTARLAVASEEADRFIEEVIAGKPTYLTEVHATEVVFATVQAKLTASVARRDDFRVRALKRINDILMQNYVKRIFREIINAGSLAPAWSWRPTRGFSAKKRARSSRSWRGPSRVRPQLWRTRCSPSSGCCGAAAKSGSKSPSATPTSH